MGSAGRGEGSRRRRRLWWARPYLPNSSDRLALVSLDRPTGALWPLRLTQIVGGRTWSLSLVRYRSPGPVPVPEPVASGESAPPLDVAIAQVAQWLEALAAEGPDLRVNAHLKVIHEARELAEEPSVEEFADVVIGLVGAAIQHEWSQEEVARAVVAKVAVNKARTWVQEPDGTWQHAPTPTLSPSRPSPSGVRDGQEAVGDQ